MRSELERVKAAADEAERLAATAGGWWSSFIGADSSAAAVRANAKAVRSLATALDGLFDRMFDAPGYATPEQVRRFLDLAAGDPNTAAREAADELSASTAAVEVGAGMARDAGEVVGDTLQASANVGAVLLQLVRVAPYLLAALAVVLLFAWGKKARARLGV
jgi:hypothetical protein